MTLLSDDAVITASLPNDVKEYLAESISSLQRARLDTLKNASTPYPTCTLFTIP